MKPSPKSNFTSIESMITVIFCFFFESTKFIKNERVQGAQLLEGKKQYKSLRHTGKLPNI